MLPLTKLNFGRTIAPTSVKQHKLGRMECNGKVVLNGMPASCEDLWRIGYTLTGLYSIRGSSSNKVETVYCDFNKLPGDEGKNKITTSPTRTRAIEFRLINSFTNFSGLQTWIGYVDLKSEPVYFNVERNTSYSTFNEAMPFDWETLNAGNNPTCRQEFSLHLAAELTSSPFQAFPQTRITFFIFILR